MEAPKEAKEIAKKIYLSFDIIRDQVRAEDFHIMLFLLSIKRVGYNLEFLKNTSDSSLTIDEFLNNFNNSNTSRHIGVFKFYNTLINGLPKDKLTQLYFVIDSIDAILFNQFFLEIFDQVLYEFFKSLGRFSCDKLLPIELSRFIINIAKPKKNDSIYNPFAGMASFGVFTPTENNYLGQEIDQTTWAIAELRLLATNSSDNKSLVLGDSINHWNPTNKKFDFIISAPPLRTTLPSNIINNGVSFRNLENFIIKKGLNDLNPKGKMLILISDRFLYSSGTDAVFKENLINQDLIESIISFPSSLLNHTGVKTSLLIINKSKKSKGFVNFIIADDFVINAQGMSKTLNDSKFYETIIKAKESIFFKKVSNETIKTKDCFLDCQRYFLEDFEGTILNDFVSRIRGERINTENSGKWVRIKELKNDIHKFQLDVNDLEDVSFTRSLSRIDETCILISKFGSALKPTYFEYTGQSIYIDEQILALRIDKKNALPIFVAMECYKDYIEKQSNSFTRGSGISFRTVSDILAIKFVLPDLQEQQKQIDTFIKLTSKINILEQQTIALKKGFSKNQFDEFASLKHSLGAPRQNILSFSKTLVRFFENDNSEEYKKISSKYFDRYGINLIDVFNQMKNDINQISKILEKGENGLLVNDYLKENISLVDINKFVKGLSDNSYNFKINIVSNFESEKSVKSLECNLTLFKIFFDNILSNTNKYAFDKLDVVNKLFIELSIIENKLEISIKNNGKPFPKNFDKQKFISKFTTNNANTGKGIGGYDINRIATYFGDDNWVLDLNSNPLYPVIFTFTFPLKTF